ncbi:MAG TPA: S-layer homology domain-containing protein [Candidatus Ozemobacteraceae bacterium]|nr:S-layer homology domain-containing protein [Candidatus Ozemobacteraceae bacterium]
MKRISMLLVLALVLSTVAASANPFSDVPFSHWAYDAVNKLAAKGILQGYPDGTYKGEKHVTRYALAMVTAKMLANVEQMLEKGIGTNLVTKSDLQTLEKLTVEFADELALLGVKVTALEDDMQVVKEDVATLKKDVEGIKDYMAKGGMEKVKLSGDMLVRHMSMITEKDGVNPRAYAYDGVNGASNDNANTRTYTQLRFQFKANIDENVTAVARWSMVNDNDFSGRWGSNGAGASSLNNVSNNGNTDGEIDLAYLNIKDMFRFGGDFTFGRNFYATGHSLLLSDYVDAIKYAKRTGDVDVALYCIYDLHAGTYADSAATDFRNIWGLTLGTKYRDHDLYLNLWGQDEPNTANRVSQALAGVNIVPIAAGVKPVAGQKDSDKMFDVEFGGKGPLGKNGHWDYDLGFAYTDYQLDIVNNAAGTLISPEIQGWMGHAAIKWDSKKEWAAKLGYTFADDESNGAIAINNDHRYDDGIETPYEDISRGNTYFRNGLLNMNDIKLQVEYRPRNTKHYFRLAGDLLDEMKDTVSNDLSRLAAGDNTTAGILTTPKTDTPYDRYNNFFVSDPKATVLTFEYRYQLAENTRIRVGYTAFDMSGDFQKTVPAVAAGQGNSIVNDRDYNMFWAELYSRF